MQRLVFKPRQQFGRLRVIETLGVNKHGKTIWQCECGCGTILSVIGSELRSGHTTSCGCAQKDAASKTQFKHGQSQKVVNGKVVHRSQEYIAWINMKARCYNPNHPQREHYGERGIEVCSEWLNDFPAFLNHIGPKNAKGHELSVDRINNEGNYEPGNVKWSTAHEQKVNQRPRRWKRKPKT